MGEKLLKAILQILVVVAKEEDVTKDEREVVRSFLLQNVHHGDVNKYLGFFDEEAKKLPDEISLEEAKLSIERVILPLNMEMTNVQKSVIVINLVQLIAADGIVTQQEDELLYYVGLHFNMDESLLRTVKNFVIERRVSHLDMRQMLFISSEKNPNFHWAKHISYEGLIGHIALLCLPSYGVYFMKYMGDKELYLNGVAIRPYTALNFAPGSILKTQTGITLFYSDVVGNFLSRQLRDNYVLSTDHISYEFPNGDKALRDVHFEESSGKLIAIMGMSGSGKTTLLNVLNGMESPTEGRVLINGIDIHRDANRIEGVVGYIPQDDLLVEDLTVFENLYYSARLCFGQATRRDIKSRVEHVLKDLGLEEIQDLKVGSPLQKTISGGQRKRVNIALELIREPAVLFVDEPTSGLSSRDSERVIDLLKELSLKGKLVLTVIHQPSSDIFKMFDKLLFLDHGGYQVYYGNPIRGVTYFKEMMDRVDKAHGQCLDCGNVNPEQIFDIVESKVVDEFGYETSKRRVGPETWARWFKKNQGIRVEAKHIPVVSSLSHVPSAFRQFFVYVSRDVQAKRANLQYLIMTLAAPAVLSFLLASVVRHSPEGESYSFSLNVNIPAYFFMSILVALFLGLMVSAEEVFKDKKILKREMFLNLSRRTYIHSKLFVLFFISAVQTMIYVLIGDYILHVEEMTFSYWMVLFSVSCFANVLGLNVSSAFNSIATIYITVPLLLIPQIILSGTIVNFDHLHPSLSDKRRVPWIGELMASRWAYEALVVDKYLDNPFMKDLYPHDRRIHLAEYEISYRLPTIERYLEEAWKWRVSVSKLDGSEDGYDTYAHNLQVVKNELAKDLSQHGYENLDVWEKLEPDSFNRKIYHETAGFIRVMRSLSTARYKKARKEKKDFLSTTGSTPQRKLNYERLRKSHDNRYLEGMLKGISSTLRIIEVDGYLYPNLYPIYRKPIPQHIFDFRTRLFYPEKHIFRFFLPTLHFNVLVLWFMSSVLILSLLFNFPSLCTRMISQKGRR
ncbi:MAG: ATP-binding cassette domain-containing protein [Cytophagales bacterium]|nr:ATP-binding cassette domain-containing protein [Cytophagales bacterium]